MQVAKWGNSLAVRIPADVVRELGLKEGDEIDLRRAADGTIEVVSEAQRRRDLVEQMRKFEGRLPVGYKFDREEANSRGPESIG